MRLFRRKRRRWHTHAPGTPPGTLTVDPEAPAPELRAICYGPDGFEEPELARPEDVRELLGRRPVTWVNVDGLGDVDVLSRLGRVFDLHPLALEDIVHTHQRPKVEPYGGQLFVVARMPRPDGSGGSEQVSLCLGEGWLVTFQERRGDCLDPVRGRIRARLQRISSAGPDYLAYAVLDAIIDSYFPMLESYADRLEALEDEVLKSPVSETLAEVHRIKRELQGLRRDVWPLRDVVNGLLRDAGQAVTEQTRVFLRDCYDHAVRLMELTETLREVASGLVELYLSNVSNRMNEVMRVLTVVSTVFIPLTFIAGVYGMNFDPDASRLSMPELRWAWGYPVCLAVMALIGGGMLLFFRRLGWLQLPSQAPRPPRRLGGPAPPAGSHPQRRDASGG